MSRLLAAVAASLAFAAGAAHANEPAYFTEPRPLGAQKVSTATDAKAYRMDVARYVYESYPTRIWKGKLPPLVHAVVVVETTVDANGHASDVNLVRGPSHAPDVTQAVMKTIRRLSPLPVPSRLAAGARFTEIWLVHKNGQFQLDALTEGQIYAGR